MVELCRLRHSAAESSFFNFTLAKIDVKSLGHGWWRVSGAFACLLGARGCFLVSYEAASGCSLELLNVFFSCDMRVDTLGCSLVSSVASFGCPLVPFIVYFSCDIGVETLFVITE